MSVLEPGALQHTIIIIGVCTPDLHSLKGGVQCFVIVGCQHDSVTTERYWVFEKAQSTLLERKSDNSFKYEVLGAESAAFTGVFVDGHGAHRSQFTR